MRYFYDEENTARERYMSRYISRTESREPVVPLVCPVSIFSVCFLLRFRAAPRRRYAAAFRFSSMLRSSNAFTRCRDNENTRDFLRDKAAQLSRQRGAPAALIFSCFSRWRELDCAARRTPPGVSEVL